MPAQAMAISVTTCPSKFSTSARPIAMTDNAVATTSFITAALTTRVPTRFGSRAISLVMYVDVPRAPASWKNPT